MPDDSPSTRVREITWADPMELARARASMSGAAFFQEIAAGRMPPPPLYEALGIRLLSLAVGSSALELTPGETHYNPTNIVHGGVAGSLIDSAAGIAVQSGLPEGPRLSTVRLSVDYMRPMTAATGPVRCEGKLVKPGRQIANADANVVGADGKLLARGQGIFAVSPPREDAAEDQTTKPIDVDPTANSATITWEDPAPTLAAAADRNGLSLIESMIRGDLPAPPFARLLGFSLAKAAEGQVTFTCTPSTLHYNPMGTAHGGLAFTLIDSASGIAMATTLDVGQIFTTVNTTVEFYRPITVETGEVSCQGTMVRRGRRIAVCDAMLVDGAGTQLARGQSTLMVLAAR